MPPELSIVVPVYNEEENVVPLAREIAEALDPCRPGYELVFVDDASTDSTWKKIEEAHAADPRVRGLRLKKNSGQSAALWTGIQLSRGPVLATLDGDRQNDPRDLPRMLEKLAEADFVCGHRINRHDTFLRRRSSRVAWKARRLVLDSEFQDTGCALRVFRREVLREVFPFHGMHRFLPWLVKESGFRAVEVPVNHRPRAAGISKYGVWNRLWRGIYDLFALSWYQKRRVRLGEFEEISRRSPGERPS